MKASWEFPVFPVHFLCNCYRHIIYTSSPLLYFCIYIFYSSFFCNLKAFLDILPYVEFNFECSFTRIYFSFSFSINSIPFYPHLKLSLNFLDPKIFVATTCNFILGCYSSSLLCDASSFGNSAILHCLSIHKSMHFRNHS